MALSIASLVSAADLTRDAIETVLETAGAMEQVIEQGGNNQLHGKILASLFYEPSTRTRLSFESAMLRLGGSVLSVSDASTTSLKKGESIEDTMKMVSAYADIVVMRHPQAGIAAAAAAASSIPFINAGDGGNEHPTQGLLDLFSIKKEVGRLDNLHVAVGCDPLHSRTIRTLVSLLSLYEGTKILFVCPSSLQPSKDVLETLASRGVTYDMTQDLSQAMDCDVLYMNRLQEERFAQHDEFEQLRHAYTLTAAMLEGKHITVLDPLPRIDEIAIDVDALPNAAYFRQAANGVPVRMALLSLLMSKG
jgi:aspartate carbamoyltransferase catalytic subunit